MKNGLNSRSFVILALWLTPVGLAAADNNAGLKNKDHAAENTLATGTKTEHAEGKEGEETPVPGIPKAFKITAPHVRTLPGTGPAVEQSLLVRGAIKKENGRLDPKLLALKAETIAEDLRLKEVLIPQAERFFTNPTRTQPIKFAGLWFLLPKKVRKEGQEQTEIQVLAPEAFQNKIESQISLIAIGAKKIHDKIASKTTAYPSRMWAASSPTSEEEKAMAKLKREYIAAVETLEQLLGDNDFTTKLRRFANQAPAMSVDDRKTFLNSLR